MNYYNLSIKLLPCTKTVMCCHYKFFVNGLITSSRPNQSENFFCHGLNGAPIYEFCFNVESRGLCQQKKPVRRDVNGHYFLRWIPKMIYGR